MRTIELDGRRWATVLEFIEDLLAALGAPDWHGRNFNALVDSIAVGSINKIEPPYIIRIRGFAEAAAQVREFIGDLRMAVVDVIRKRMPERDVRIVLDGED